MKTWMKTVFSLALAAAMIAGLAACGAKEKTDTNVDAEPTAQVGQNGSAGWVNGDLTLNVPSEYTSLVLVDMPNDDPDGVLFSVSEKASVEAGKADGHDASWGDGWLFGIRRVDEDTLHEMLCWDMSGAEVFAKDAEGNYYVYTHPTDVRLYRQNEAYAEAAEQWTMLNDWAWSDVRSDFLAENTGLEPFERGNSMLDMYLARAAYQQDANYTVTTLEYGALTPDEGFDAAPYAEKLMDYLTCEEADLGETPDGEYIVLSFPDEDMRFDFFRLEGKGNYVRQVGYNGEYLMKLTLADRSAATDVMQAWCDELAANAIGNTALGYTPDDLVGVWAEKIAGRGFIEISKADESTYQVEIHWPSSAFEQAVWEMTATPIGKGGALRYENAKHYVRTFTSDTEYTDEVEYEDGAGTFSLNSAFEIMWDDEKDGAGDNCVFINAG